VFRVDDLSSGVGPISRYFVLAARHSSIFLEIMVVKVYELGAAETGNNSRAVMMLTCCSSLHKDLAGHRWLRSLRLGAYNVG
jgi:hypothetical protein